VCENYFLRWTALFLIKKKTEPAREEKVGKCRTSSVRCQPHVNSVCTHGYVPANSYFPLPITWNGETGQLSRYSDEAAGWTTEELGLDSAQLPNRLGSAPILVQWVPGTPSLRREDVRAYLCMASWRVLYEAQRHYLFTTERDLTGKGGGCDVRGRQRPRSWLSIPLEVVVTVGDLP